MPDYMKRFIVFTDKDLENIKAGKVVVTENCNFSERDEPYDIYCVSEEWMKEYDNPNIED